jgi:hypothetical protein
VLSFTVPGANGDRFAAFPVMKERNVTTPELIMIAGTRVALGLGLGFLFAGRLNRDQRKAAGWALFGAGALTTVPLVLAMKEKRMAREEKPVVLAA